MKALILAVGSGLLTLPGVSLGAQQVEGEPSVVNHSVSCPDDTVKNFLRREDFKDTIVALREAANRGETCADAKYMLAYSLLRDNHPAESLSAYTAAAVTRKPSPVDLRNVALDYVLLEDYADARHWVKAALSVDAKDAESWYVLGRIQYTTSDASGAASSFEKALQLAPRNAKTENNLGLAYEALNEPEKAIEAYHQAIAAGQESGKPSEQPLMNLAILLSHKGDLQTALNLLVSAVAIAPENVDVQERLGHVYLDLNKLPEALLHLEKAVSLHPADGRLHFLLGQVYRRSGMTDKSKSEFALAASLNGTQSTPLHAK